MSYRNHAGGAGFGRNTKRRRPGLLDYVWVADHASRPQRREALRLLRQQAAKGNNDAIAALAELEAHSVR